MVPAPALFHLVRLPFSTDLHYICCSMRFPRCIDDIIGEEATSTRKDLFGKQVDSQIPRPPLCATSTNPNLATRTSFVPPLTCPHIVSILALSVRAPPPPIPPPCTLTLPQRQAALSLSQSDQLSRQSSSLPSHRQLRISFYGLVDSSPCPDPPHRMPFPSS